MANKRSSVVVTGANRGIGLELVSQYLADDWQVYGCCRRPELATQLAGLASNSALSIHQLDVGNPGSVKKLALALSEQSIDLLINNAGIYGGERQSFGDIDYAQWTQVLEVNTLGPYRVSTALANPVGNSEQRLIVNVSSAMGSIERYTTGGHYIYRSSKAALNMVTVNLAHDLRSRGITVLSVHPGWVRTDMGGSSADISPQTSAAGLRQLISNATIKDSGRFFSWDGSALPW
ncbi:MAG TPA: SDR family oxidoreductase [Gammaproteobacteria bacterium]|jgi:NAD(P)-dependent dehydrogenase (short-subunit alcohol dehydrogenase family)|nr:SDR family oxidoreductase [Arenicellales bacterium]HIF80995.1 SDR family oxidoreductase [Gammaproteobacteria bacterium]HIM04637.1 SDR family oxidoreductase [Gammaproteobacteria bacterium]|tara:strand:- start:2301 stop:3002 length:702 start_codon:yes stop_codon:yes gene_type:complete